MKTYIKKILIQQIKYQKVVNEKLNIYIYSLYLKSFKLIYMDFFKDFSDLSNTPGYPKYDQQSVQRNKNSRLETGSNKAGKDDFDDLLDNLMSKQQIKKSRRNIVQPYSSQNLGPTGFDPFLKTTEKFNISNTQKQINFNYGMSKGGNKGSKKSILDDLMSQDNKSYKSGATGRRDNPQIDNLNLVKFFQQNSINQSFQPNTSVRAGMRPPLKKKAQSREPSIFNDDRSFNNIGQIEDLDIVSLTPKMPKRHTMQPEKTQQNQRQVRLDLSPSKQKPSLRPLQIQKPVIQERIIQKIVHIKQDNKQLAQRHQQQIKLIKQSYERQINSLKQNYQKMIKDENQNRKVMVKTYQQTIDSQKKKWQKMLQTQTERVKSLYEWQNRKKAESYQLEVRKLKQLIETITKNDQKRNNQQQGNLNSKQIAFEYSLKLKQLEKQKQRLEQQKLISQAKRRQLQSQQHDFDLFRRKQQSKLNDERKKLFQYETEIRKREVEAKKQFLSEKQSLAVQMVNNQVSLSQARENIRHEYQKLDLEKQLFDQQKMQYQKINNKILSDLKSRQKAVQAQRQELNTLQVDLYKKLNTLEMMAVEKGIVNNNKNGNLQTTLVKSLKKTQAVNRSVSFYEENHKQNYRNRINSQLDTKIADTKNRYAQMQQLARNNSLQKQSFNTGNLGGKKIHLQKYIEKLSKEKLKLQKY